MKSFIDKCCKECWHSPENQCPHFIQCCTEGPLCHHSDECTHEVKEYNKELLFEKHDVPVIFIGAGTCGLAAGAAKVEESIKSELLKNNIEARIVRVGCIGYCAKEVIVDIKLPNGERIAYSEVTPKLVPKLIQTTIIEGGILQENLLGSHIRKSDVCCSIHDDPFFKHQKKIVLENCGIINPDSIDTYIASGGFKAITKALKLMPPENVVKEILDSGLRGRGGAGFPTGKKWEFALKQKSETKYLICNADEGDPGAFMDRSVLESDPYKLIEGMMVAAYAIGANFGYIYCRAEYPLAISRLTHCIHECEKYGLLGDNILNSKFNFRLKIKKGAGAFVCGEETALIASIEGKRGMPKPRPPFPAVSGLWGKPTVINNVETLSNISSIISKGAEWFASVGTEKSKGTKVFALSGKIVNTGLVEIPMGITLEEVVFNIGGGIPFNKKFKAVQIGGPSGGCLPMSVIKTQVDYESLKDVGAMMGSGGFVVMDEDTCMVDIARFFLNFIQSESCGKCVPCREGTKRMLEIIERIPVAYKEGNDKYDQLQRFKGIIALKRLADVIRDTSLCGLGQSAPNPVLSGLQYFKEEYEEHLFDRRCRSGVCKELLTFTIDTTLCSGCGLCKRKCGSEAIIGQKGEAHYILQDKCIQCGMCLETCRFCAINVN
ncbi:MAG: NADH-quinone oxidoreductase subunit NuoF [Ignavibacteriales bacterium]|jgi:NADH:ubiquinone oxidoreductase subunit F (NADH-binding)/(2Fe-2S) ferredoxin|nr:NADH-quinone oxidoreductase subunit NuoF [Ignavibacteriales bacterium]MBP7542472.1 NADH-quinone oxidoreductase subunit NuoF [Ignavibacteriaceae bacterium]MBP9122924.1 NADH-quinone oxidoreductase subunit NuoF [Ignavibacteriaceae bacterium]MCC6638285.1 NADH-quinone oxidoreductase subunit NuoF [Ignavibacteriaceae bacterium]